MRPPPDNGGKAERAILRLKGGRSCLCVLPDDAIRGALLAWARNPLPAHAALFHLQTPHGRALDVPATEILGVELAPPFCLIKDFLAEPEMERALAYAKAHEQAFGDATVSLATRENSSLPDYHFRQSRTLGEVAELMPILVPRLTALMPQLWSHLRMEPVAFGEIECQLAVHGDGAFFKRHTDNGAPDTARRQVSCVYYFHREPRRFTGGNLCLYGTVTEKGARTCGERWFDIEPPRNSLIVFPSDIHHEVTPVTCASAALADQRLSINGWLCR